MRWNEVHGEGPTFFTEINGFAGSEANRIILETLRLAIPNAIEMLT